jgi:hypothetical protein
VRAARYVAVVPTISDPNLLRALQQTWQQIDALWDRFDDPQSWSVEAGSSLTGDDQRVYPYSLSMAARKELSCAIDHLMMASRCFNQLHVLPPFSYFPLFRAALETACTAHWLLAPTSRSQRVLRRLKLESNNANDLLSAAREQASARGEPVAPLEAQTENEKAKLDTLAQQAGFPEGVGRHASYEKIVRAADTEVQGLDVSALAQWRVFSAITHGRDWAIQMALGGEVTRTSPDGLVKTMDIEAQPQHVYLGARLGTIVATKALELYDNRRLLQR